MTVKLHRVFCLGLWLAFAVTPGGLHAALTPEKLYQKVLPSVMRLDNQFAMHRPRNFPRLIVRGTLPVRFLPARARNIIQFLLRQT